MGVELIESPKAIAELKSQWHAVYEADPEANYFLSYDWLFGTPNGAGSNGIVVAATSPRAEGFVSFLPIRVNTEHEDGLFHNELNLSGNFNSDYTGLICRPGFEEETIPALAKTLGQINWRRLRLLNFGASEERSNLFLQSFSPELLEVKNLSTMNPDGIDNGICPHVMLNDDWDEFLAQKVSSNTRQKIRRFLRQIEGGEDYRITHANSETIERDIETLIRMWSDRWAKIKGKRLGAIQRSFRRMLNHAFETGTLFMPMLWHEDRVICINGTFVDRQKGEYHFYVGARDMAFKGPSPGLVLHAYSIRRAISEGVTKYDFLRGNEAYKYAFGSQEARIQSVLVSSKSGRNLGETLDRRGLNYVKRRSAEFFRAGDLAHAEKACAQVLELDPHHSRSRYLRGVAAGKLGDGETACRVFEEIVEKEPQSLKAWIRLGRSAVVKYEDWNEASQTYSSLLKKVPDQSQVPYILGRVLLRLGQFDLGVAVLEATLRRKPEDKAVRAALEQAKGLKAEEPEQVETKPPAPAETQDRVAEMSY